MSVIGEFLILMVIGLFGGLTIGKFITTWFK